MIEAIQYFTAHFQSHYHVMIVLRETDGLSSLMSHPGSKLFCILSHCQSFACHKCPVLADYNFSNALINVFETSFFFKVIW